MPHVDAVGVAVQYVEHGAPAQHAEHHLVVLPGFGVDHRSIVAAFEPVFRERSGWRRLYVDYPGVGGTQAPEWVDSTDAVFEVVAAAVDALVPDRLVLAGVSYGAYLAAGLAASRSARVTGLALVVPMVQPRERRDVPERVVLVREDGVVVDAEAEELCVVVTAETVRRGREQWEQFPASPPPSEALERIAARYAGSFPLLPPDGSYPGPVLVLLGRQDDVVGFNDQWQQYGQLPRATVAVIDRAGHMLSIEAPVLHDALIHDWLDRVEGRSPLGT